MSSQRILSLWLFSVAFMVMVMVGIGAITRLTESGLSITEWKVISGTLPPLHTEDWQKEFDKYQMTPEFSAKHSWMTLSDFKKIYFWEWFHRFWGRLIGAAFLVPMVVFWAKGWIPKEDRLKYLGLFMLGGAQGALGWFMVKSGLVDRPSVSHFRLAAHLSTALVLYACLITMAVKIRGLFPVKFFLPLSDRLLAIASLVTVSITIIWGAFVAGLDAGMIYNQFPMMGSGLVPPELGQTPFFSDPASVQFTHRILAMLTGLTTLTYAIRLSRYHRAMAILLATWVCVQIGLGIVTLLTVVWIPVAVMHQIGAVILLTLIITSFQLFKFSRDKISS